VFYFEQTRLLAIRYESVLAGIGDASNLHLPSAEQRPKRRRRNATTGIAGALSTRLKRGYFSPFKSDDEVPRRDAADVTLSINVMQAA
jgi:hypothetical protein